ncbi:MAG: TetR/AcrR family transcriptional regulator [Proteobacteria bacterium]|nr:TetR/AcrR family transcriptional regulator [Pseudomonadota bacterium]
MGHTSTDGRSQRAEAKRQARRAQMLRAAEALFSSRGYYATSVADVIEAAQVSRGTFYLYFDSKETLFHELVDEFVARITSVVRIVDPAAPDPTQQIYENIRRVVDVMFDNRELAILVLRQAAGVDPRIDDKIDGLHRFMHEMVAGALANGATWGITRPVNDRIVATALVGSVSQVFLQYGASQEVDVAGREAIARALFDLCLRGLLANR